MRADTLSVQATLQGCIVTVQDALVVIEACLQGYLCHLPQSIHATERKTLIRHGSVFVYELNSSGIREWVDGLRWRPPQDHDGFQVYHQEPSDQTGRDVILTDGNNQVLVAITDDSDHGGQRLRKKTMLVTIQGVVHHLVAYLNDIDVLTVDSVRVTHADLLRDIRPRSELLAYGSGSK